VNVFCTWEAQVPILIHQTGSPALVAPSKDDICSKEHLHCSCKEDNKFLRRCS
jgi:hypothetical protein